MDAYLMVHSIMRAIGCVGPGDFVVLSAGKSEKTRSRHSSPGADLHPRLFRDAPSGTFSLNVLYDRAEEAGRLFAIVHDGEWFHIGTPDSLIDAEDAMSDIFRVDPRRDP
jgi:MurNAc alpha-1-phosphate uridylyltransferase